MDKTLKKEISDTADSMRSDKKQTSRHTSENLENILYHPFEILDHGFLRVIDYLGTQDSIVQAARVSYGKGTKKVSDDRALIRYLIKHRHTSPLEMCEIVFHFKLPIFVARQIVRHRVASLNELSGRFSILDSEFYVPEELFKQSTTNKQGRGESLDYETSVRVLELLKDDCTRSFKLYDDMINMDVSREIARMNLPVNTYTQWYWKMDLHNLLHFLSLRMDAHAQ
jgi:thymidylate synthase (FAD)